MTRRLSGRAEIRRLLRQRGIRRYALFLLQQEGKELPGGLESLSGFVLDDEGRVHGFWFDYDNETQSYALDPFYPVEAPERRFEGDAEFNGARAKLSPPGDHG